MAMSFTRPDPSSPAAVADARFNTTRRGFDQGEVTDFLRMVAAELGRLQERERFLERELRTSQSNPDLTSVQLDEETVTRLLGEETARVLNTARESAAEIRQKAEQSAAQLLSEAADEAARLREEAEIEASRRRSDASADAEAELSMAKQQGREMVNEARAYRERVLSELARRRELAREQIEQLIHGRDRLMQSFERARLVAVDVVAELQPIGEPDEYVNLAPTTGPVPVMLPNTGRPDSADPAPEADDRADEAPAADDAAADEYAVDMADDGLDASDDATNDDQVVEITADEATDDDVVVEITADEATDDDVVVEDVDPEGADQTVEMATVDEVDADEAVEATEAAPAEDGEDAAVDDAAADDTAAEPLVEADDSPAPEEEADAAEAADAEEVAEPADDVVVDLFARLRAGTRAVSSADAAQPDDADDATSVDESVAEEPVATAVAAAVEAEPAGDADVETNPFRQRDADLTPLIVSSARRIKRVLADEQNEALEALRGKEPVRTIDDLLPAGDGHRQRYRSAIGDDLRGAAEAGAAAAGMTKALGKTDAAKAVAEAEAVLDEWITAPLRERLERAVTAGDGDNVSISKSVRAVYREWKTQHIDEQLDDVLRTAYGHGAYAAIGRGTPVAWVSDPDHQVCADCDDNTLAGAVVVGNEFPTGHRCAPAHLGCRCLLLPADH